MAEREIGSGKAGASCWVETLLEAPALPEPISLLSLYDALL